MRLYYNCSHNHVYFHHYGPNLQNFVSELKMLKTIILLLFCLSFSIFSQSKDEKIDFKAIQEKLKPLKSTLSNSYRLSIYFCFFDTPDYNILTHRFKAELSDILPVGENGLFSVTMESNLQQTQKVINAELKNFRAEDTDVVIGIAISSADKEAHIRCLHLATKRATSDRKSVV